MKKIKLLIVCCFITQFAFAQSAPAFDVEVIGEAQNHVVLIPGFSCSGEVWNSTVDGLKETHTCHVLTMAGFAGTPTSGTPDWTSWRTEIANYILKLEIKNTSIIGHSLGGMMALDIASAYPEIVKEIVVVDALPCLSALNNPGFEKQQSLNCTAAIDRMTNQSSEQFEMMQRSMVAYMSSNSEHHDQIVGWALDSDRATLGKIFCQLSNVDLRDQLENVKCPALVLLEAPFAPLEPKIAKQYEKLEKAQLVFAPKGLHFIMYDAPEWYGKELTDFLKK